MPTKTGPTFEQDVAAYLLQYPGVLGKGFKVVGQYYATAVGVIVLLCQDASGKYVVVVLKRNRKPDRVVAQLQRYLVLVENDLAEGREGTARGIILVGAQDVELNAAVRGSPFAIEVKELDDIPPISHNA